VVTVIRCRGVNGKVIAASQSLTRRLSYLICRSGTWQLHDCARTMARKPNAAILISR
jgi:hypothetical protein